MGENFAHWLQSTQQIFSWVLIFALQCQETTPTNSFACKIPVHGKFISVLRFALAALPSKNPKISCYTVAGFVLYLLSVFMGCSGEVFTLQYSHLTYLTYPNAHPAGFHLMGGGRQGSASPPKGFTTMTSSH